MKYKFDITQVNIINLNGVDLRASFEEKCGIPFDKVVGNMIYENTGDLGMVDIAKKIYHSETVVISEHEKQMFEELLQGKWNPAMVEREIFAQIIKIED